jgi:hypothetical protein
VFDSNCVVFIRNIKNVSPVLTAISYSQNTTHPVIVVNGDQQDATIFGLFVYIVTISFGYILCCVCFNLYCGGFILFCGVCVCVCLCVCGFCNVWVL